jgi:hypothetical protein
MLLLLAGLALILAGGLAALLLSRSPAAATACGVTGAVAGSALALVPTLAVTLGGLAESLRLAWSVPYGALFVELDSLSARRGSSSTCSS